MIKVSGANNYDPQLGQGLILSGNRNIKQSYDFLLFNQYKVYREVKILTFLFSKIFSINVKFLKVINQIHSPAPVLEVWLT